MNKKLQAKLKEQAHYLKAELNVGKEGFTESFKESLLEAFNTKELLKIKFLDNSPETTSSMKEKILNIAEIEFVQQIGHTFVLYKPIKKNKKS
jgi:RNA-binding protein